MTESVITFGCRLNTYESEVIRSHMQTAGMDDAVVINTCAVTTEAERQSRQTIRRLRRDNPNIRIIVTGCAAQINPESYSNMPEVTAVIGNQEKLESSTFFALQNKVHDTEKALVNDIMSVKETASHLIQGLEGRARAFIQVQNGCNHRCTFCIIPFGRGNSRSVPIGEIATQVRQLVDNGTQEVVITGVDISDYGKDLPGQPTLGQMSRRILALVPELPRLRISSIDAVEVDDDLYRLIAEEPRLMPHMHISVQAGDDMVLKRMKRRHLRQDILNFCDKVRDLRPDIVFGADIIAGFPTETDEMFKNTLNLVEDAGLTYLHVFPYSSRPGTPAARMPQVPKSLRKERAELLRIAGNHQHTRFLSSQIGQKRQVLIEKDGKGHTEHFAAVQINARNNQLLEAGQVIPVTITHSDDTQLYGDID